LRTDPNLLRALNGDLAAESRRLLEAAPGWVAEGWTMEAEGQAQIIMAGAPGVQIVVEMSEAERAALATFPVQGYGLAEVVEHLIYTLRRDFLGALGRGLAQAQTPGGVMVPLVQVSADHASRVGRAAGECFLAGTQAARAGFGHELARALGGAP
jgi:hypothetical protein